MKRVKFHPAAAAEMIAAASYYQSQQEGLGHRFLASAQDTINRILLNPRMYPVVYADVRRCLTKTFPFGVLFRDKPRQVIVMAVMHLRRDPDYWKGR